MINSLFKHLLEATEIDGIQCRYVAFKLTENGVKTITSIERIEPLKYSLKTDYGSYKIEVTIIPLPITKVDKVAPLRFLIPDKTH